MPEAIPTQQQSILQTEGVTTDTGGALRLDLRTSPHAIAEDFAPPASSYVNLTGLDNGLSKLGGVMAQQQDKDDALWAQNTALQARAGWMDKMSDPDYKPSPDQFKQDFTDFQNKAVEGAPTQNAQNLAMTHLNGLAVDLYGRTINMQYQQRIAARQQNIAGIANSAVAQAQDMDPEEGVNFLNQSLTLPGGRGKVVNDADKLGIMANFLQDKATKNPDAILAWANKVRSQSQTTGISQQSNSVEPTLPASDPKIIDVYDGTQKFTPPSAAPTQGGAGGGDAQPPSSNAGKEGGSNEAENEPPFVFPGTGLNASQSLALLNKAQLSKSTRDLQGSFPSERNDIVQAALPNLTAQGAKTLQGQIALADKMLSSDPVAYANSRPDIAVQASVLSDPDNKLTSDQRDALFQKYCQSNLDFQNQARAENPALFMDKNHNPVPVALMTNQEAQGIVAATASATDPQQISKIIGSQQAKYGSFFPALMTQLQHEGLPMAVGLSTQVSSPSVQNTLLQSRNPDSGTFLDGEDKKLAENAIYKSPEFTNLVDAMGHGDVKQQKDLYATLSQYVAQNPAIKTDPAGVASSMVKQLYSSIYTDIKENGNTIHLPASAHYSGQDQEDIRNGLSALRSQNYEGAQISQAGKLAPMSRAQGTPSSVMAVEAGQIADTLSSGSPIGVLGHAISEVGQNLGVFPKPDQSAQPPLNIFDYGKDARFASSSWKPAPNSMVPPGQDSSKFVALTYSPNGISQNFIYGKDGKPILANVDEVLSKEKERRETEQIRGEWGGQ